MDTFQYDAGTGKVRVKRLAIFSYELCISTRDGSTVLNRPREHPIPASQIDDTQRQFPLLQSSTNSGEGKIVDFTVRMAMASAMAFPTPSLEKG
jgi:hypothetical protein